MSDTHSSRPSTPVTTETVIHWPKTPQAPKKPKVRIFGYLKPTIYTSEIDVKPETSNSILDALSRAGVRKPSSTKAPGIKMSHPAPRKLTVSIVDGRTDHVIHKYVPSRLLMSISTKAAEVLGDKPWAGRFKVYGKYDPAIMNDVINAIMLSHKMPIATDLTTNLFTYEACLRLGIPPTHPSFKPLLVATYSQISSAPVSSEILSFITYRLGAKDAVFAHTANVLCHQRFKGEVDDLKVFENMVARKPALQKKMVQIDQAHKARREALNASKRRWGEREACGDGRVVTDDLEAVLATKEDVDVEQAEELLRLLKSPSL